MAKLDANSRESGEEFELPNCNLLEEPEDFPFEYLAKKARKAAVILEKTFAEFGLEVRVAEIDTGPVITQFELELEKGLRLSKVANLADDLARLGGYSATQRLTTVRYRMRRPRSRFSSDTRSSTPWIPSPSCSSSSNGMLP